MDRIGGADATITTIRTTHRLCESGNFIQGSTEVLLISQPSLTRNMQSLEDVLGVQLFQRSKNKLILTETGKYTVQQARKLLKQRQTFLENV
ncbi:TPA: LysR family transcriptional regulator [Streptococcus suis]